MAAKLQKSYFDVLGLCCSTEVALVEKILRPLDGVKEITVIIPARTLIVLHDDLLIPQSQIARALNQAGLEANVRVHGETKYKKKWPSPYVMASGVLLALSILKFAYHPFQWVALGAVAIGLPPVISRSISGIRNLRFDINMIVLIAVGGTIALRDYLEAGSIVFLFTVAQWLESRASHKATAAMSSLMSIAPQKATIAKTGEEVDVNKVELDTILAVKAGEAIPIDGIIIEGNCEVDEKMLTGEAFPVAKQLESTVWAGTINLNGYVTIKTTALAEDCAVAKMAKLVEEAQNKKSKVQRLIDNCAQYYTPVVVLISVGFAVIPAALRVHNQKHWFHLALVVLVSACPCALILSTPVATFCALSSAATTGLIVKGGDYLEILAKIRTVAFDKTGTITRGEFVVTDFQSLCEDVSLDTLIYWVSSIESKSSHPMASVLVEYGRLSSIEPKLENVEEFQNYPGEGIYGKIDGKEIYIGNKKIAQRAGCTTAPSAEIYTKEGKTNGFVYCGANLVGMFSLSDACRTGAVKAIQELKSLGIKATMLTGDSRAAAMHAQDQLGHALDMVHAELLPADKARIIEDLKKDGPVAMVGDGMNDAPALATADIGISMGISGSALATETGNVILMSNDICKIPKAIRLARKSHRKVIENIIMSITTKGAILALAFAGHPLVWAAVLTDVGTCLLVIFNSMLLLHKTPKRGRRFSNLDGEAKIFCDPVNCSPFPSDPSSLSSCRKGQCTNFIDRQGDHVQCAGLQETKYCGHGGCDEVINHKRFETQSSSTHRQEKCRNSVAMQCSSVDNIINAADSHGHGCCNNTVLKSCRKNKCTDSVARQCGGACDDRVTVADDPSIFREDKSNDGITEVDSHGHRCCNVIASSSCRKDKCTDSISRQSGSESDDRITVADPEDNECRNTLPYSLGSSSILEQKAFDAPRTSPCTKVESADSICTHVGCGWAEGLDKIKQCDHGCDGPVTHSTEIYSAEKRIGSDLAKSRMSQLKHCCQNTGAKPSTTCSKPAQQTPNVKRWISACCVGKTVETSCQDYLQKREPCSANNGSVPSCASLDQAITGCNVSSAALTGYVESGSTTVHTCKPLKKNENIGGCSKSFSRECCRKRCHFGANLSEIIVQ